METILHGLTAQLFDSNFDDGDRTSFEDGLYPSGHLNLTGHGAAPLHHDAVGAETETGMKAGDEIQVQDGVVNVRTTTLLKLEGRVLNMRIIDAHRHQHQRLGNLRLLGEHVPSTAPWSFRNYSLPTIFG